MGKKSVFSKRVFREDKFLILKVEDVVDRQVVFKGSALLSDKKALRQLFLDAEAKGVFLK